MTLYHVGCGRPLFSNEALREASRTGGMAMACSCGALSPLMVRDLNDPEAKLAGMPMSLMRGEGDIPHLEFYLGFSDDFQCAAKTAIETWLRSRGSIGFAECPERRCQEEPERFKERWAFFGPALSEWAEEQNEWAEEQSEGRK